ncbi:thioredoxin [Solirubrobacter ginsenosidimutans]|uniref:Thioredoxin n=1 Tax=Solirubrobacter ginsenosidimutans TaxID=490573 RepID=A0A9X3S800_9ACTN|nr:thioredoxin [Solirubrobacter ginsenosidimutans]MDA0163933.1 thioredoxin [Solirubrobacter ginsenosidimutans]
MPIDATEETFERDVIQRSFEQPVVVDFWAEWCGPCRSLGPVIEKAVAKRDGQVDLVKVDTDANPRLSQAFAIQSIPAVKAFKDGKVVDEFIGALPPAQVEQFLDGIVPSLADALVAEGGDDNLRRALELEPGRADAAIPLARSLAAAGDREGALELLANVPSSFAADGLATRLRLSDDPSLLAAFDALDAGETEKALDALIEAIAAGDAERKDELRKVVVGVLDELGPADPLARDARRKLASALY